MRPFYRHSALLAAAAFFFAVSSIAQPAAAAKRKVNFVAIGYDIQNNPKAQTMLQQMADAVQKTGGKATVLMAGADPAQLDKAFSDAMDAATGKGGGGAPSLILPSKQYKPGERIRIAIENPPPGKFAWIGFYAKEAPERDYLKYILLAGIDNNIYEDVLAPDQPGVYNFRLFKDEGYDPVAISEDIAIGP